MTGAEILSQARDILGLNNNTAENTKLLLYAEQCIYGEMLNLNWPELIHENDSFITDGSDSYDLTSEIDPSYFRVIAGSIHTTERILTDASKKQINIHDPDHSGSSTATHFIVRSRTKFSVYPFGSSGETIYLDWIEIPDMFDADTTEANMPFDNDRHMLILEGMIWRGMRKAGKPDWLADWKLWKQIMNEKFGASKPIQRTSIEALPRLF